MHIDSSPARLISISMAGECVGRPELCDPARWGCFQLVTKVNQGVELWSEGVKQKTILKPNTHRRRRRDETVLSRRRRRRREHNSQLVHDDCRRIRSTIWKLANRLHSCLTTWILIDIDNFFNNEDITTSLLKKLSISIKIGVIKRYGSSSFGQFPNCRPNPSAVVVS